MNEGQHETPGGKLPLPQPRSPQVLDEKILGYARANAPQKRPFFSAGRATGLATAAVVCLAVLISEPQRPAPSLEMAIPALQESLSQDMEAAMVLADGAPAAGTARASKAIRSQASADSTASNGEATASREAFAEEPYFERPATDAAGTADRLTLGITGETLDMDAAAEPVEQEKLQRQTTRQQLDQLATLLAQGNKSKALSGYQELRRNCPDCRLPDTLEQALANWQETAIP